eukprot:1179509-Prorocentrum_minimum.AAC.2
MRKTTKRPVRLRMRVMKTYLRVCKVRTVNQHRTWYWLFVWFRGSSVACNDMILMQGLALLAASWGRVRGFEAHSHWSEVALQGPVELCNQRRPEIVVVRPAVEPDDDVLGREVMFALLYDFAVLEVQLVHRILQHVHVAHRLACVTSKRR